MKAALRKSVALQLAALDVQAILLQSQAVKAHLLALPAFRAAASVSCYLSMPAAEVDTAPIVSDVLASGKTLFVPKIRSKNTPMDMLKIYSVDDLRSLQSGTWGIREPDSTYKGAPRLNAMDSTAQPLDIVLLPGVAFDPSLSRLGHGKGYYDRFISSYTSTRQKTPLLVGLALREQILDNGCIPMSEHDWRVDLVITPDGILEGHR